MARGREYGKENSMKVEETVLVGERSERRGSDDNEGTKTVK